MSILLEEVQQWNTPIIKSFLLWKFTISYCENHTNGDAPVGILHFLASTILSDDRLLESISDRRANLQSYIHSFEQKKDTDLLLSIHELTKKNLNQTLFALEIAVSAGLLYWDTDTGKIFAKKDIKKPMRGKNLKSPFLRIGRKAEILGKWFSQHDVSTIAAYLKVVL